MHRLAAALVAMLAGAAALAAAGQLPVPLVVMDAQPAGAAALPAHASLEDAVAAAGRASVVAAFVYGSLPAAEAAHDASFAELRGQATASSALLLPEGRRVSDELRARFAGRRVAEASACAGLDAADADAADLLLVRVGADEHACVAEAHRNLADRAQAAGRHLVSLVTADSAPVVLLEKGGAAGAAVFVGVTHIEPDAFYGLLLGLLLLTALLSGVCCIASVQTPLRFPAKKVPINKEY